MYRDAALCVPTSLYHKDGVPHFTSRGEEFREGDYFTEVREDKIQRMGRVRTITGQAHSPRVTCDWLIHPDQRSQLPISVASQLHRHEVLHTFTSGTLQFEETQLIPRRVVRYEDYHDHPTAYFIRRAWTDQEGFVPLDTKHLPPRIPNPPTNSSQKTHTPSPRHVSSEGQHFSDSTTSFTKRSQFAVALHESATPADARVDMDLSETGVGVIPLSTAASTQSILSDSAVVAVTGTSLSSSIHHAGMNASATLADKLLPSNQGVPEMEMMELDAPTIAAPMSLALKTGMTQHVPMRTAAVNPKQDPSSASSGKSVVSAGHGVSLLSRFIPSGTLVSSPPSSCLPRSTQAITHPVLDRSSKFVDTRGRTSYSAFQYQGHSFRRGDFFIKKTHTSTRVGRFLSAGNNGHQNEVYCSWFSLGASDDMIPQSLRSSIQPNELICWNQRYAIPLSQMYVTPCRVVTHDEFESGDNGDQTDQPVYFLRRGYSTELGLHSLANEQFHSHFFNPIYDADDLTRPVGLKFHNVEYRVRAFCHLSCIPPDATLATAIRIKSVQLEFPLEPTIQFVQLMTQRDLPVVLRPHIQPDEILYVEDAPVMEVHDITKLLPYHPCKVLPWERYIRPTDSSTNHVMFMRYMMKDHAIQELDLTFLLQYLNIEEGGQNGASVTIVPCDNAPPSSSSLMATFLHPAARVVVPSVTPQTIARLSELAIALQSPSSTPPIHPVAVLPPPSSAVCAASSPSFPGLASSSSPRLRALHEEVSHHKAYAERLEQELLKQTTALQELEDQHEETVNYFHAHFEELEAQRDQRTSEAQQFQQERDHLRDQYEQLQVEVADLRSQLESLHSDRSQLSDRLIVVKHETSAAAEARVTATQLARKADTLKRKAESELEEARQHQSRREAEHMAQQARLAEQLENEQLKLTCSACMDAQPAFVYQPCGHATLCEACDRALPKRVCPKCNTRIMRKHRAFF